MSHDKVQDFSFYAFDVVTAELFVDRLNALKRKELPSNTIVLKQVLITSSVDLEAFRTDVVAMGYEGVMIRLPGGKYKYGRSSVKEQILLKMKLFKDEEFIIVGYECKYHNSNEAKINELGRTARSTSKDGMVALDTLGVLYLKTKDGKEFGCGSGFDDKTRDELWAVRDSLKGKLATIKYFDVGGYDVPRFGVFKGIRDRIDLS